MGLCVPFWVIFGPFWVNFGPFCGIFGQICGKFKFFLRDSWGQDPRFKNVGSQSTNAMLCTAGTLLKYVGPTHMLVSQINHILHQLHSDELLTVSDADVWQ